MSPQYILLLLIIIPALTLSAGCSDQSQVQQAVEFDAQRAYQDVIYQVGLGPRVVGSEAHNHIRSWMQETLAGLGWEVDEQAINYQGAQIFNIIARRERGPELPWIILGAHYDSRIVADKDPNLVYRTTPVPGANDGASGVAVLMELARIIPADLNANIWLVFFDAEDGGSLPGSDWVMGSRAFVENLQYKPESVVIVDMVGDKDLTIFIEKNSDPELVADIWEQAHELGYTEEFISFPKYRIIDDHLPFIQAGIPAVDIIDFDYPYWHTTADTVDKISARSLKVVGDVVFTWLIEQFGENPR